MSGANQSAIVTDLAVDSALQQNANYRFDSNDRQYIDNQIRGTQQHLVDALIRGVHATYVRVSNSSPALQPGDCVCIAALSSELQVAKALSATLIAAGSVYGVVLLPASPGSFALVAIGGAIPSSVTGLDIGYSGPVRANPVTARCELVFSVGPNDYGIGFLGTSGYLNVVPGSAGSPLLNPQFNGPISISSFSTQTTTTTDGKVTITDVALSFQTTNGSQAVAYSAPLLTNAHTAVDVECTAVSSDVSASATYKRAASWRRSGGTVTDVGSTRDNTTDESSSSWDLTLDDDSLNFRVLATGAAATTIRWGLAIRIQSTIP